MNSRVNMNKHNGLSTLFWRHVRKLCEVNNRQNDRLKSGTIDLVRVDGILHLTGTKTRL